VINTLLLIKPAITGYRKWIYEEINYCVEKIVLCKAWNVGDSRPHFRLATQLANILTGKLSTYPYQSRQSTYVIHWIPRDNCRCNSRRRAPPLMSLCWRKTHYTYWALPQVGISKMIINHFLLSNQICDIRPTSHKTGNAFGMLSTSPCSSCHRFSSILKRKNPCWPSQQGLFWICSKLGDGWTLLMHHRFAILPGNAELIPLLNLCWHKTRPYQSLSALVTSNSNRAQK